MSFTLRTSAGPGPDPEGAPRGPRASASSPTPLGNLASPIAPGPEPMPACSVCLWGGPRDELNRVLYSLSSELDARALWLEVACGEAGPYPVRFPEELGDDLDRRYVCDRTEDIVPGHGARTMLLPGLIRPDERPETLTRLRAFLRLPASVQEMISRVPETERGRVLAVSNLDRVTGHLPQSIPDLKVLLDAITSTTVSVVAAYAGSAPAQRDAFDFVFELRRTTRGAPGGTALVCEKALSGATVPPGTVLSTRDAGSVVTARRAA